MKVVIATIFPYPHVGGASTHLACLIEHLSARGILQGVVHGGHLVPPFRGRLAYLASHLLNPDGARCRTYRSLAVRMQQRIAGHIRGCGPWVIHCHDPLASCAALRAKLPRAAIVQTVHGPWSRETQASGMWPHGNTHELISQFEQEAFAGIDMALPVDRGQADILAAEFGMPSERMRVIENAVDVQELAAVLPCPASQNGQHDYFVAPRRLVPKNGVEFAIRAMALLNDPDVALLIAGDGPLRKPLEKLARDLSIGRQVRFLGGLPSSRLLPLMKGARAVLVPSVPVNGVIEATSLAVLETMALRVPVIGSAIGGIADILSAYGHSNDSANGFLVPPGDAAGLAWAMRTVLGLETAARQRLVERAFTRVRDRYGIERWIAQILAVYEQVVHRRKTVPRTIEACA